MLKIYFNFFRTKWKRQNNIRLDELRYNGGSSSSGGNKISAVYHQQQQDFKSNLSSGDSNAEGGDEEEMEVMEEGDGMSANRQSKEPVVEENASHLHQHSSPFNLNPRLGTSSTSNAAVAAYQNCFGPNPFSPVYQHHHQFLSSGLPPPPPNLSPDTLIRLEALQKSLLSSLPVALFSRHANSFFQTNFASRPLGSAVRKGSPQQYSPSSVSMPLFEHHLQNYASSRASMLNAAAASGADRRSSSSRSSNPSPLSSSIPSPTSNTTDSQAVFLC